MERRAQTTKVRIETRDDGSPVIVGYASVFYRADDPGTEYELFPGLVEHVGPRAFERALDQRDDVRGLFNHDPSYVLGRTPRTLRLSTDDVGLRYEIDPPDTQSGRDAVELIRRGDVDGSSFAFRVNRESLIQEEQRDVRVLEDVQLFDVGPVTFPAYKSASSALRAESDELFERWLSWKKDRQRQTAYVQQRLLEIKNYGSAGI